MIRVAAAADIPRMLELGREMHAESRYARHAWDDAKVHVLLQSLIVEDDGLALVAEKGGQIIGGFLGWACDHWCTGARQSFDYALFVGAEHRGSLAGARLLLAYAKWARGRGVPDDMIGLGITTGVDLAASTRLFRLCGFEHVGHLFTYGDTHARAPGH